LERWSEDWAIRALIEKQRSLVRSDNPEERSRTLWIAAMLDEVLAHCTDRQLGGLMILVQERFGIFEPEFALCHHVRGRLLRSAKKHLQK
jgi:hypothetical protein